MSHVTTVPTADEVDTYFTPNGDLIDNRGNIYDVDTGQATGSRVRPRLADYRGTDAKELKARLLSSGEVFDIIECDEDLGAHGAVWKLSIRHGDNERGVLFFGVEAEDKSEPSNRDAAFIAIRAYIRTEHAAFPAKLNGTVTKKGQPYYWLEDPE